MKIMMSGLLVPKAEIMSRTSSKTGSTRADTLEPPRRERPVKKLVRQATMQEFEVVRIERKLSAKVDNLLQLMT